MTSSSEPRPDAPSAAAPAVTGGAPEPSSTPAVDHSPDAPEHLPEDAERTPLDSSRDPSDPEPGADVDGDPMGLGSDRTSAAPDLPDAHPEDVEGATSETSIASGVTSGSHSPTRPDSPDPSDRPPSPAVATTGSFEPYSIGDPGRAFSRTVSLLETKNRDSHDIAIDAATINDPEGTPRLIVRAASSRGLAHQQYGDPRQDDHCFVLTADGEWLVCLVADGVSSGEWSHLAAKVATEEGAADIAKLLATSDPAELPWREVLQRLADQLADICATLPSADAVDIDLTAQQVAAKMATTLVIGVVATRPDEDGTHAVTVVRLGDSSGWILDAEDGWIPLGDVKNAGNVIAESATACLPLVPDSDPVVVETTLGDDAALVLITDGIGDPLGSGQGEVATTLGQLWARPPHPVEFAAQVGFGRKTFDDDRGAIVVWPVEPE